MISHGTYFNKFGRWWIRLTHPSAGCLAIIADVDTGRIMTIDKVPSTPAELAGMLGLVNGLPEVTG